MLTNSFKKIVDNDNSALGDFVRESMVILQFTRKAIVRQKESVSIPFVQEFYDMFYKMYRIMFDVAIRNKFLKRQRGEYVAPETEKKTIANQISSVMMAKDLILNEKNIKEEFPHRSGTDLAKGEFLINLIKSSALSPQSSSFLDKSSMMTSKGESIEAFKKHISQFGILNRYEVQYLVELYIKNIEGFDVIKDLVKYVYAIRLQNRIDRASVYLGDNKEMALSVYHLYSEFTMQAVAVEWYTRQGLKPVLQERIDEYKRNNGYTK